ncbi:MAG TPA: MogA/MoaB family molybdenum cofactor biosynthesis protein [Pyrinomonadaceae bacterium]|nr:MogA/MoaB family molybdenum cofactor biosynthesis protein [Pyrinomonadaceae bacterium]
MANKTKQIRAAVVTASDSRKPGDDVSGATLVGLLLDLGAEIVERRIVSDDRDVISKTLRELADSENIDLILTTGGTGLSPRDNTPEATLSVIERHASGIAEAIRAASMEKTPLAMLSRGVAGTRGTTLIVNFPGSPKAVSECFDVIRPVLKHAVDLLSGNTLHEKQI